MLGDVTVSLLEANGYGPIVDCWSPYSDYFHNTQDWQKTKPKVGVYCAPELV